MNIMCTAAGGGGNHVVKGQDWGVREAEGGCWLAGWLQPECRPQRLFPSRQQPQAAHRHAAAGMRRLHSERASERATAIAWAQHSLTYDAVGVHIQGG